MPVAVLTGLTLENYISNIDLCHSNNDSFYSSSPIVFSSKLLYLNTLIGDSINLANVTNYNLYVRITPSLNNPLSIIFDETYNLTASNIINDSVVVSIKNITDKLNHDFLCSIMNDTEKNLLYKQYTIIFRIYSDSNENTHLSTKNTITANDITQNLNIFLNTAESGPYETEFRVFDLLSLDDFTTTNIINELSANTPMIGGEAIRCFYPLNKINCPVVICFHGVTQEQEDYDAFLSRLASYGYFCLSVNLAWSNKKVINELDSAKAQNLSSAWSCLYGLKLIDLFKKNYNTYKNSYQLPSIDFQKINLFGHSRGGGLAHGIKLLLDRKNTANQANINLSNININTEDIKSIIKIAPADSISIGNDGLISRAEHAARITGIQENQLNYFSRYINTPVLTIRTQNDSDPGYLVNIDDLQSGITYSTSRNVSDRFIILNHNLSHYTLNDAYRDSFPVSDNPENRSNNSPILFGRNENYMNFNSYSTDLSFIISDIVNFIAIQNYNSNKIKKLYLNSKNIKNKKIDTEKYPHKILMYMNPLDIKTVIDSFTGITLSSAGINGLTFSTIGYTYDFGNDADYYRQFNLANFQTGLTYISGIKNNKISGLSSKYYTSVGRLPRFSENDTFNGIIYTLGNSLFLPIETNFSLGYTFGTSFRLSENEYFCLTGSLKYFPGGTLGNTMDSNFHITIFDSNSVQSTLTSNMAGNGFHKNIIPYTDPSFLTENNNTFCSITSNILFRVGDFKQKNNNINLNTIKEILLNFGPNYGSTFCHISLDDFIILKEY